MSSETSDAARNRFPEPVRLEVEGLPGELDSLEELDFALGSKTDVPSSRFADLLHVDDQHLAAELEETRASAARLQRVLTQGIVEPASLDSALEELGAFFFSTEHHWRELFSQLLDLPPGHHELKLLAIAKYRRYLLAFADVLEGIRSDREQSTIRDEGESEREEVTVLAAKETATRDLPNRGYITRDRNFLRLPKRTTIEIMVQDFERIEFRMSSRRFGIDQHDVTTLLGCGGEQFPLREGRNLVGRALYNDVVIDARYNDVSRSHLIIDIRNGRLVGMTDLSSGGTFVPPDLVAA